MPGDERIPDPRREPRTRRLRGGWRLALFALLVGLVLLTAGCGDPAQPTTPGRKLRIGLMITPKGLNDQGFNDLAYAGLKEAERKHGIEAILIEPATMRDPEASLRFFAGQSFDAIIAVGVAFLEPIRTIASEHPQLPFFVIDSTIDEGSIRGVAFREDEGSFLCGYLAARVSRTGKIGFIGGVKIEVIERFALGYRNGAAYAASATEVVERYLANDFSGFNRPDEANALALDLYKNGCDVIYAAAGASGLGVISAAAKTKLFAIGVDMNQDAMAPGHVLTSMLKRVDLVVEDVVKTLKEGKDPGAVKRSYGMADGAIDLTDFQFSQQVVGDELIAQIGALKQQIISGALSTRAAPAPPADGR
jgi:basic membrane protein A